jgi:Domain of unknown function DUF11
MKHLGLVRAGAIIGLALLMILVSAAGLVRQPARAAGGWRTMQDEELTAEGVVLAYDHGTHKAGEVIALVRIIGGHRAQGLLPDVCLFPHLHDAFVGIGIKIIDHCAEDPIGVHYMDQDASACGHGKVIAYRADVKLQVDGPPIAEVGKPLTYTYRVTNDGPHNADYVIIYPPTIALGGRELGIEAFETTYEECLSVSSFCIIESLPAKSSKTAKLTLKIKAPEFVKEGTLKATFEISATAGCPASFYGPTERIDPNQENNVADQTTTLIATPDFALTFETPTVTATAGTKARVVVNIVRVNGHAGSVTLTPPPKSNGIKPKPSEPITTTDNSVNFKFQIAGGVTPGVYTLPFTARDESGKTRTATVTLIVQ